MPTVILDTNALMMPVECDVRVFEELDRLVGEADLVVPESVIAELDSLAGGGSEEARAASVGHDLADRCRVVETDADYADDAVVELATAGVPGADGDAESASGDGARGDDTTADDDTAFDGYVVTNDGPLRDRLLDRGVRVIGLRGANTLAVTEP